MEWTRIKKLILVFALFSVTPQVRAQTETNQHQQNFENPSSQVHAKGHDSDSNVDFATRYAHPKTISSFGERIDWLFSYTSWVTFIFFCLMAGSLGYFLWAYRARPGHNAYYTHGTSKANNMATRVLDIAVFISLDIVLIVASYRDTRDIIWNYPTGPDVVKIQVMPQQWAWNFKYPGADDKFGTADDINTINDLRVPKGKKVLLQLKSKDVIHGFMIPNIRIQIDALPGVVTKFWFDTNEAGDYELACYHHCGTAHYKMKAFFKVMEENDYNAWIKENSAWSVAKFDPDDKFVEWGWNWGPEGSAPSSPTNHTSEEVKSR